MKRYEIFVNKRKTMKMINKPMNVYLVDLANGITIKGDENILRFLIVSLNQLNDRLNDLENKLEDK